MVHVLGGSGETGHWGAMDATIDWCEKNYEITAYIAEFMNTTTNSMFREYP